MQIVLINYPYDQGLELSARVRLRKQGVILFAVKCNGPSRLLQNLGEVCIVGGQNKNGPSLA